MAGTKSAQVAMVGTVPGSNPVEGKVLAAYQAVHYLCRLVAVVPHSVLTSCPMVYQLPSDWRAGRHPILRGPDDAGQ